ncbi:MAG: zinc carboxypeptidase [Saprospiraceae bacterium]|nr:zinc carboxypeptidase [Saprospiraceae bacterium]
MEKLAALRLSAAILLLGFVASCCPVFAQNGPSLGYYLPKANYNPAIPTPASYLGWEPGEWHVSHDQLVGYMRELARTSERVALQEYGRSHEGRPLLCLFITDASNHARLEEIKTVRGQLADPSQSGKLDAKSLPAVNYMGYSIHGNEASGSNAALLVAYHLAAAQSTEVEQLLLNTVILLDPCFNPDGLQRFSSWVNSRRSLHGSADPAGDEFNEPWPRGRYNHYWFDLNRDWLVAQQPESGGRVALFQAWRPNVLTDHHEMGSNATFFFQPGIPSRVHPLTPDKNQELTAKIATYHARLLSEHRVLFYTKESFDDFYYGKGSTYPDVQGSIGILFEQASSRGSAQETDNGLLTFPYSIKNQVLASLSTLKAVGEMRVELNEYLRDFYKTAIEAARKDEVKGYLFADNRDLPGRELLNLLMRHRIEVRNLAGKAVVEGRAYEAGNAFWVPCEQAQYRLVKAIFERRTNFQDSVFYDISAWTLPDAFGVDWAAVKSKDFDPRWVSQQAGVGLTSRYGVSRMATPAYAYVVGAVGYELPMVLSQLLKEGIRVKVAMKPFEVGGRRFAAGSLVVPAEKQPLDEDSLLRRMNELGSVLPVFPVANGMASDGPDLGSSNFPAVRQPKVLMLTGEGITPESAGEIWHLLDTRYALPVTMVNTERFSELNLLKYNVVILPSGTYSKGVFSDKIREFASNGGTVVAVGGALRWLKSAGLVGLEFRNATYDQPARRPYDMVGDDRGARRMAGSIFEAELDLTHPVCFGYESPRLPMFLSDTLFVETTKNPYATPAVFTANPLLAGYIHPKQQPLVAQSAAVTVGSLGRGRVVCFAGNPNFRAFWYGTNRMFANAIFFGNLVSGEAAERK